MGLGVGARLEVILAILHRAHRVGHVGAQGSCAAVEWSNGEWARERRESKGEGGEGECGGGGSQGGGGLGTGGGGGCAPSSRGEETLLSPSPLPKSMATSAAPVRDGADRRTDGPTKASEQIRARTSMSAGEEMYEASLFRRGAFGGALWGGQSGTC